MRLAPRQVYDERTFSPIFVPSNVLELPLLNLAPFRSTYTDHKWLLAYLEGHYSRYYAISSSLLLSFGGSVQRDKYVSAFPVQQTKSRLFYVAQVNNAIFGSTMLGSQYIFFRD